MSFKKTQQTWPPNKQKMNKTKNTKNHTYTKNQNTKPSKSQISCFHVMCAWLLSNSSINLYKWKYFFFYPSTTNIFFHVDRLTLINFYVSCITNVLQWIEEMRARETTLWLTLRFYVYGKNKKVYASVYIFVLSMFNYKPDFKNIDSSGDISRLIPTE